VGGPETCRALCASDTAAVLELLRNHPIRNVLLEYLVRSGALGRVPGFYGREGRRGIDAVLLVGVLGGAFLESRSAQALRDLGRWAAELRVRPRHITAPEDLIEPFWEAYSPFVAAVQWSRREPLYLLSRGVLRSHPSLRVRRAEEQDAGQIVANSAQQHLEDLKEDRQAFDPAGFRRRHLQDLRAGHWWVARERGHIVFQAHVGPENDQVIQIGGVFTPPALRRRGYATRALASLASLLLERKPCVSLFCDEANRAARRVYERIGFEIVGYYRSILLSE
jgi:RimJ/RimL family protein N-acetyltransferase